MAEKVPHPFPYQGSKRNLASRILQYFPDNIQTLYEPFAGSAAVSLAAAAREVGKKYCINDLNPSLMALWEDILFRPKILAQQYEKLWHEQLKDPKRFYLDVRNEFNRTGSPHLFLYLLARCVKASIRYNSRGEFNQSADNRRRGMKPATMQMQIAGASHLLANRTRTLSVDYRQILSQITPEDLVYMDPPYQGVCEGRDRRYVQPIEHDEFVESLHLLNARKIRYLISYDGKTGDKTYGRPLPDALDLTQIELQAGRSSQATLLGRRDTTVESLYLSPALAAELERTSPVLKEEQLPLIEYEV